MLSILQTVLKWRYCGNWERGEGVVGGFDFGIGRIFWYPPKMFLTILTPLPWGHGHIVRRGKLCTFSVFKHIKMVFYLIFTSELVITSADIVVFKQLENMDQGHFVTMKSINVNWPKMEVLLNPKSVQFDVRVDVGVNLHPAIMISFPHWWLMGYSICRLGS